jgi:hypothetical protein
LKDSYIFTKKYYNIILGKFKIEKRSAIHLGFKKPSFLAAIP